MAPGSIDSEFLPVLVHEMGHWIGLGHITRGESIMAPTATEARCIDLQTARALYYGLEHNRSGPSSFRLH
jgi:hypothetical protein